MTSDRFGLPPPSESEESTEARAERLANVATQTREFFSAVVEQAGLDEATRIWSETLRKHLPRKRGRPHKVVLSGWDALFLEIYDVVVTDPNPETVPRHLGRFFHQFKPSEFHSSKAAEKRIRRLLKLREASQLEREDRGDLTARYRRSPPRGQ